MRWSTGLRYLGPRGSRLRVHLAGRVPRLDVFAQGPGHALDRQNQVGRHYRQAAFAESGQAFHSQGSSSFSRVCGRAARRCEKPRSCTRRTAGARRAACDLSWLLACPSAPRHRASIPPAAFLQPPVLSSSPLSRRASDGPCHRISSSSVERLLADAVGGDKSPPSSPQDEQVMLYLRRLFGELGNLSGPQIAMGSCVAGPAPGVGAVLVAGGRQRLPGGQSWQSSSPCLSGCLPGK